MGKFKFKGPFGKSRRRIDDNINIHLKGIEREVLNWINLAKDRDDWQNLWSTIMHFRHFVEIFCLIEEI